MYITYETIHGLHEELEFPIVGMVSLFPECIVMYVQETFGDMKALSKTLHDGGFKGVWMLDPGIKCEEGYEAYDTGSEKDVWVQTAGGKHYVGMLPPLWTCFSLCFWLQLWYLVLNGVRGHS
jgi:hypothetical protein